MSILAKTWNTLQLTENIAANTITRPVSWVLNKTSIGIHNALGLETNEPMGGYKKDTFSIIEGVKDSYNKTFLPGSAANKT